MYGYQKFLKTFGRINNPHQNVNVELKPVMSHPKINVKSNCDVCMSFLHICMFLIYCFLSLSSTKIVISSNWKFDFAWQWIYNLELWTIYLSSGCMCHLYWPWHGCYDLDDTLGSTDVCFFLLWCAIYNYLDLCWILDPDLFLDLSIVKCGKIQKIGLRCHLNDSCISDPCKNGAQCSPAPVDGGYECECRSGWQGDNCDEDVDECGMYWIVSILRKIAVLENIEHFQIVPQGKISIVVLEMFSSICKPGWYYCHKAL